MKELLFKRSLTDTEFIIVTCNHFSIGKNCVIAYPNSNNFNPEVINTNDKYFWGVR